jgi:hypothetical protein
MKLVQIVPVVQPQPDPPQGFGRTRQRHVARADQPLAELLNAPFNPDSAVEREVMSKEQTFRSKDNAFCL